jgi:hypothetical protein
VAKSPSLIPITFGERNSICAAKWVARELAAASSALCSWLAATQWRGLGLFRPAGQAGDVGRLARRRANASFRRIAADGADGIPLTLTTPTGLTMPAVRLVWLVTKKPTRSPYYGIRKLLDRHIVDTSAQKSPRQNAKPRSTAIGTFVNRISLKISAQEFAPHKYRRDHGSTNGEGVCRSGRGHRRPALDR